MACFLLFGTCNTTILTAGIGNTQIRAGIYQFSTLIVSFHSFPSLKMRSCQKKRRLRVDEKCAGSHCPFQTRCDSIRGKCDSVQCDFVQQCRSLHLNNMPHWRWLSGRDMLEGLHFRKEQHLGILVTLLKVECARFVQCVLGWGGIVQKLSLQNSRDYDFQITEGLG